jgi:putative oxidoreductase
MANPSTTTRTDESRTTTGTGAVRTTARTVDRQIRRPVDLGGATHALLRIGAGILFFQHGAQKLLGWFGGVGDGATVQLFSLLGLAGALELVGGLLLVIGIFVRPLAFVLAIEMVVAYAKAHMPQGGWPVENGGELALLYALVFAFFAAHGAGPLSLDRSIRFGWRREAR